ncbi:MAG: hypothetical protein K2X87_08190 [Gemmataceae bacterium]|nr:hypothetical protein [Gemmataceae bacterium]
MHHRLAGRHRRVELLPQAADVDLVLGEQRPQVHEVLQAPGDPVELEADDEVDLAGGDVALEPLELRAVLVLRALAGIDVEFERGDFQVLAAFAELDLLLDLVLLGDQAVTLRGLSLRRDADVPGDPQGLVFFFLLGFSHVITALSGNRPLVQSPWLRAESACAGLPANCTRVSHAAPRRLVAIRARTVAISRRRPAARTSGADFASGWYSLAASASFSDNVARTGSR